MNNRGVLITVLYLTVSGIILSFIPPVQQLGALIRLVIFHGVLSQAGLYIIYTAGIFGLLHLLTRNDTVGYWSRELGLNSVILWVVGTGLSLVSMQVVWGGMMWNEPFTIAAFTMAAVGIGKEYLISSGGNDIKTSAQFNAAFAVSVIIIRLFVEPVMHPENPIGRSDSVVIRLMPMIFLAFTLLSIFEFSRWRIAQRRN